MDKNNVIGLILIFALLIGFGIFNSNRTKKIQEEQFIEQQKQATIQAQEMAVLDSLSSAADTNSSSQANATQISTKAFSNLQIDGNQNFVIETDKACYTISKKGGFVAQVELKNVYNNQKDNIKTPLILFNGRNSQLNMDVMLKNQTVINTADYYFLSDFSTDTIVFDNQEQHTFSLKLYPETTDSNQQTTLDKNSYIEYLYTFNKGQYRFDFDIRFVNMSAYLYPTVRDFTLNWEACLINVERSYDNEKNQTHLYYRDNLGEVDDLSERKPSDKKDFTTPLQWVAFKQQFFTSILIADNQNFNSGTIQFSSFDKQEKQCLKKMQANLEFQVENLDNGNFDMSMYFGPNQYRLLKEYDAGMERMVQIGWGFFLLHWINRFAVIPVFDWLENYGLQYGIIILILSLIVKSVLFPFAYKSYLSTARMRVLKPEIEAINERYPKQEDMMKKQQATMSLYKSAGANPASGCLPMLLQLPFLIAMFRFFPSAYELRQQPFLWADDLSSYDSIYHFNFNIPFYGDHVSLFCLLMTASTLIYTWLNNKMMAPTGNAQNMKMMKIMMYVMPVMFLGFFNSFSSGLTYYYLLVNLITFLQMWIFRMLIDEKKLRLKMQENMKKPVKKSKWQQRMEEIAKQQQQMARNRK
jgi:YidC/Oxa1 family membrane protein insertase